MSANYMGTPFETVEGEVLRRVSGTCKHLTSNGSFTDTTPVTAAQVDQAIDDAYYLVVGELIKNGYSNVQTNADVKQILAQVQAMDAICSIEFSVPVNGAGEPNTRYISMAKRRDTLISDYIRTSALEQLGATRNVNKSDYLEATGRSDARKQTVYDNTDIVPSRFKSGFGQRRDYPQTKIGR